MFTLCSYGLSEREGFTFAMSIIGMRAGDWRDALDYSGAGIRHADISGIVQHFNGSLGFTSAATTWGADQVSAIHFRFANISFVLSGHLILWHSIQRLVFLA